MTRAPDLADDLELSTASPDFTSALLSFCAAALSLADTSGRAKLGPVALHAFHALCRQLIQGAPQLVAEVFIQLSSCLCAALDALRDAPSAPETLTRAQGWIVTHCRLAKEVQMAWPYLPEDVTSAVLRAACQLLGCPAFLDAMVHVDAAVTWWAAWAAVGRLQTMLVAALRQTGLPERLVAAVTSGSGSGAGGAASSALAIRGLVAAGALKPLLDGVLTRPLVGEAEKKWLEENRRGSASSASSPDRAQDIEELCARLLELKIPTAVSPILPSAPFGRSTIMGVH